MAMFHNTPVLLLVHDAWYAVELAAAFMLMTGETAAVPPFNPRSS